MGIHTVAALLILALPNVPESQMRIETGPALGLGVQPGVGRLDPSDILRFGNKHVVLYTRVDASDRLYPAPFAGEIWWASSKDEGHTWKEEGKLLGAAGGGRGDALGVFDPNLLRVPDGGLYLFYAGIGPEFNFRFEEQMRPEPTGLFVLPLRWNEASQKLSALPRGQGGATVLAPSSPFDHGFDSRRVRRAKPFLRNNLVHLYYRGTNAETGTRGEALGLATGDIHQLEFKREHESRAILPFRGDALLMDYSGGVLALFTGADRGAWWASDGEHFAPLDVQIRGRLSSPGLHVPEAQRWDGLATRWGLHVARDMPDPWLERFELSIEDRLPSAVDASKPEAGRLGFVADGKSISWEQQHLELRAAAKNANAVFLGGTLVQGFAAAEQETWNKLFEGYEAANLGVRGDTTSNLLWRVDHGALPRGEQRLILIQVSCEQTLAIGDKAIMRGVDTLLRRVRARKPLAEVVVIPPQPTPWMSAAEIDVIRQATRTLALFVPQPKIRLIDPWVEFYNDEGHLNAAFFAPYGEGLSVQGYSILAEALLLELPSSGGERE